jgi:hypothetical protein
MEDSRIMGDYLGDLVGDMDGDDELAALVGDIELGRRLRRGQRRRASRGARRLGITDIAAARAASRSAQLSATNTQAIASGEQLTAGHYVADGGQRTLYLPFSAQAVLSPLINNTVKLTTTVQRPMSVRRIIVDSLDNTTLLDSLNTVGISNISIGVQPVFNAQGVAPAKAFANVTVGNNLETMVARVGTIITIELIRLLTVANPSTVSGYMIGVSAEQ